ncbi:MAG: type III-A CRISPR-associated protein Csm2 [Lewinellaceae bacterium]|nr:type III-A CRISPR-associated protein Csm2 [Saprospiraceae bacterium]MCB9338547.1 type III-A CRISPR-associated protein Csm2 [Lewinellaceae bacterium]
MPYPQDRFKPAMIQHENGLEKTTIEWASEVGKFLAQYDKKDRVKELSTSQLRRFFGQIKRLQAQGYKPEQRSELLMLGPQLAYAVGRDRKKTREGLKDGSKINYFYEEVNAAIKAVADGDPDKEKARFQNFVNLVEAIVAYHKYHGGE